MVLKFLFFILLGIWRFSNNIFHLNQIIHSSNFILIIKNSIDNFLKINFHRIFLIILVSSALGILVNTFNPDGIDFIRKERILKFENDASLLLPVDTSQNSATVPSDNKKELIQDQSNPEIEKQKEILKDKETQKEQIGETKKEVKKDEGFSEPKAITLEQAFKLYKQGIVFIDARESEEYAEDHIKDAVSIPFYEYDENAYKLNTIKKDQPIVVYCAGTDCDLSILLGDQLFEMGYKKTYIFFGGWSEWLDAKYPTEKEVKPDSTKSE